MKLRTIGNIFKGTLKEFNEDRVLRLSAAMAYYTIFSIGPLLVLIIGLAGLVFGEDTVRNSVAGQMRNMVGEKSANLVNSMMSAQHHGTSLIATIVGGIGLLFGAAGVFGQLQDSLNTIWEVKARPNAGLKGLIRQRFLSLSMVLGSGFLLLVSLALSAFVNSFAGYIGHIMSMPPWIALVFNGISNFLVVSLLFALIFKVLPDVKMDWSNVWVGAIGTALLFVAGKFLLGWYLGRESTTSGYGAASGFVLILMYIYYSSLILFFGAEFTQVYARVRGARVVPTKYAMPVSEYERENEGMPRTGKTAGSALRSRPEPAQTGGAVAAYKAKRGADTVDGPSRLARPFTPPLQPLREQPWSFVRMALTLGLAAGALVKFKTLRKGLKFYLSARRATRG